MLKENYISVKEAALKWKVSERRVHQYCKDNRIPGVKRFGRAWAIPANAEKPIDPRGKKEERAKNEFVKENMGSQHNSRERSVGAVIVAAGEFGENGGISPFTRIGTTSLVRRIVLIFQQANVSPIVVITGYQALELEHHLSDFGVIFIHNENYKTSDKFASAKLGLKFLQDKCDKIFFASLKIPMFMPDTLRKMVCDESLIIVPRFEERNGHPLLLDSRVVPDILKYKGTDGMRGAMAEWEGEKKLLHVEDEGVLLSAENISRLEDTLPSHNEHLLHPFIRLSIETDRVFFDGRAKLLLFLIKEFHSVQSACKQMAISRGKAWEMISKMEEELGFTVVERRQGGSRNRQTKLTKEGECFLEFYKDYEEAVRMYAIQEFQERFAQFKKKN